MTVEGAFWVVGAYLAGTFPSTYVVLRALGARDVIALARRETSAADAHILIRDHVGGGWSALAMAMDVAKGFLFALAASVLGDLPAQWLGAVGAAIVAGHAFPPYMRALAGRGLAAGAGVYLWLLPLEMVVAGVIMVVGIVVRWTPLASTVGFAAVPLVAWLRGQPPGLVAMSAAIFVLMMVRRLEGITAVRRAGHSWPRALYYRTIHDADGPFEPGRPLRGKET